MSFRMTLSDLECLSEIFNDTKHTRSVCDSSSFLFCNCVLPFDERLLILLSTYDRGGSVEPGSTGSSRQIPRDIPPDIFPGYYP